MLRLEPLVSLEKDVFPKIPREHLLVPPKHAPRVGEGASNATWLNYKGAALSIIGRYNSDTIIFSYIGFYEESRTAFFATYDIVQTTVRVVYRQRAVLMVGCTLNVQGSLIGFTYKTSKGSIAGVPDMFESCVAEVSEHGQCYLMTAEHVSGPTSESQWLHFLPVRANGTHLLLYVYNTHADLFAVYTTKKNGVHSITAHPHFRSKLAEHLCWFQWDEARSMIYILTTKRKKESRGPVHVLRGIEFQERKPVATFKRSLDIDLQLVGLRAKDNIQIVRFGAPSDHAYCLCQQHANPHGNMIKVSVWIFHHDIRFDIEIPFVAPGVHFSSSPGCHSPSSTPSPLEYGPDYLTKVKVFFDALGDLLVIYVPGVYLQLIDCAVDHEPTVNLILSGPTYNTPLPEMDPSMPTVLDTFEMRGETKGAKRLSLLDRVKGLLYEYKLNQNTIVTATSVPDPAFHKQLLALALLHVQDEDTPESIMLNLLRKHPGLVSADLMKYFLMGAPFREYRKKNDVVHKKISSFLPIPPSAIPANAYSTTASKSNTERFSLGSSGPLYSSTNPGSASHSPRSSLSSSYTHQSPIHQATSPSQQRSMAIPPSANGNRRSGQLPTLSESLPMSASSLSSLSYSSVSSFSAIPSTMTIQTTATSMTNVTTVTVGVASPSPLAQSLTLDSPLSRGIARPSSPNLQLGLPVSSSYQSSTMAVSPTSTGGSLSGSPTSSTSSLSISLGSAWHQPDITEDWNGYQLVQGQWPDHRAQPIQLPVHIVLVVPVAPQRMDASGNSMASSGGANLNESGKLKCAVIQARLWTAGKDPNDNTWQLEHMSGSPNVNLRSREVGSLPTLVRLFSEEDCEAEWMYLFQSNDGVWYRARLQTCMDPVIGPGFSSPIPVVSIPTACVSSSAGLAHSPTASSPTITAASRKSARINLSQLDWQHVHDDYIPQQTMFKKLIGAMGRIFGSSDEAVPKDRTVELEDFHDPRRLYITGAYCKHFFENLSGSVKATRAECFEWASHYRSLQASAVGKLYNFIHVCAGEMPMHLLFQVYSTFHEILEELMLPIPIDFYTKFTVVGFFCLPRHIFAQYANQGIFQLTRQFVDQLPVNSAEDARFKYLMLAYLPKEDALAVLKTMNQEGARFVSEEAIANEPDTMQPQVDLEDVPPNEFLPLGAYHQALSKKKFLSEPTLKFVCDTTSAQFKRTTTNATLSSPSGKLFFGTPQQPSRLTQQNSPSSGKFYTARR